MKARIAALASILRFASCLALGFATCPAAARAGTASGAVYVTTLPASADVWVDGTYVGRAPVLVDALAPGHHALTITRTGWLVTEVDVTVPAGGVAMSSTRLAAGPRAFTDTASGSVLVREIPGATNVSLDGVPFKGTAGKAVTLAAGIHHIALTTAQGRTTRSFTVLPDTSTELVLRVERTAETRSAVVAPADDYIGADAYAVEGTKIVVRSNGHVVVAHYGDTSVRYDGATLDLDAAPTSIGGKLYLPLALLEKLSGDVSKTP